MLRISKLAVKNSAHYFNEFEPEFIDEVIEGIMLEVPYAEKDQAKASGARWNPKVKNGSFLRVWKKKNSVGG